MTKSEILQIVVNVHNMIVDVNVSGNNTILVGDSIRALRYLGDALQKDIDAEAEKAAEEKKETEAEAGKEEGEAHESA